MKTEIYECDRCHKKATTPADIKSLDLTKAQFYVTGQAYSDTVWSKDWCVNCRKELGVFELNRVTSPVAVVYPSLEDMVREIVRQELPGGK